MITVDDIESPPASPRRNRHVVAHASHVFGELLLTAGAVILLFVGYQLFWTGVETARAQDNLLAQLATEWGEAQHGAGLPGEPAEEPGVLPAPGAAPVARGDAVAVMRIPRFGDDYAWAIVEGIRTDDLRNGPGHYPDSAMPGEIGNFAVAGHRTTYGAPLYDVEDLRVGDTIVLETAAAWLTYGVTEITFPVPVDSAWAVSPNPEEVGAPPTRAMMTLTTCHPRFSSTYRFLVFSELQDTLPKGDGVVPAALSQGA